MNRLLLCFLSLSLYLNCLATPFNPEDSQTPVSVIFNFPYGTHDVFDEAAKGVENQGENGISKIVVGTQERLKYWEEEGRDFVKQHGNTYEILSHPAFSDHKLRITSPTLCDPDVKQYSGYLDITDGKHLFFWFFEARSSPETAPLILWLNGGPGCSSMLGLLLELGPCWVTNEGYNTTHNEYSWNNNANMIFLDQPVNVGYSYTDDGSTVDTSPVAGIDVYAFLEIFLTRFEKYALAPFHIAAESYGGTYAPHFASAIYHKNKELESSSSNVLININLASIILGNGLTDPYIQFGRTPAFACEGPYPIYDDPDGPECKAMRSEVPNCQRLLKSCYDTDSKAVCVPAWTYCTELFFHPVLRLGLNPYDVRRKCNEGEECYEDMAWIDTWMNLNSSKKALGVNPSAMFESCSNQVNRAFFAQGDSSHNSASLLPELVNDGIRLLVYAGEADYYCNFMGNEAWVLELDTVFKTELNAAKKQPWVSLESGELAGVVRSAGGGGFSAGNVTFVAVHDAGHMVPYDQSEHAFDLITRWINNVPLSSNFTESAQVMFGE